MPVTTPNQAAISNNDGARSSLVSRLVLELLSITFDIEFRPARQSAGGLADARFPSCTRFPVQERAQHFLRLQPRFEGRQLHPRYLAAGAVYSKCHTGGADTNCRK